MGTTRDADNPVPEMIETECKRLRISRAEIARRVGTTQTAIDQIIERRRALGPALAVRLAAHLHLSQAQMFALAGIITEPQEDVRETRALQRVRSLFNAVDEGEQNEIADLAEFIIRRRRPPPD